MEKDVAWYKQLRQEREKCLFSQEKVAEELDVSVKTVSRWERGKSIPYPANVRKLAGLLKIHPAKLGIPRIPRIRNEVMYSGNSTLPDENQLDEGERVRLYNAAGFGASATGLFTIQPQSVDARSDWSEMPHIGMFHGRETEAQQLQGWIEVDRCQVVALVGIGGTGKTALATYLVEKLVARDFDYILWRSLQHAPHIDKVLYDAIYLFSEGQQEATQALKILENDIDSQIKLLIGYLQMQRCLLVLDNFESVLEEKNLFGKYRDGYEKYGNLLLRLGEIKHRSCLLLTSREKPGEMQLIERKSLPARSLSLGGVEKDDARLILGEKDLQGNDEEWKEFIDHYSGNPLALKLVAESIRELFIGDIGSFLKMGGTVFGSIFRLLDEQFSRLSPLESTIMYWLAIERQEVLLDELGKDLVYPVQKRELLETIEALLRRSMLEISKGASFTLQPVIMEYVTNRFVEQVLYEINSEEISLIASHVLIKALAKDYIRDIQVRLILEPIAAHLSATMKILESEDKLKKILSSLKGTSPLMAGYAAGNLLNLLIKLKVDINGYDLSYLTIRQAFFQNVALRDVNFTHADLDKSVFADNFSSVFSVALCPDGKLLAAGTANGEIRLWDTADSTPKFSLQGHTEWIRSVTFSPSGRLLASGSEDQTIRLWDVHIGECTSILQGHNSRVYTVAFCADENTIASGSDDQKVKLWDVRTGKCHKTLNGHEAMVYSVAFSPDGKTVASGSGDKKIKIWDIKNGECIATLAGHTDRVRSICFSPNGSILVSGSGDRTVCLWDIYSGKRLKLLQGHVNRIWSVAFTSDGNKVVSGSDDQTIRVWDTNTGECLRTIGTHGSRVYSVSVSNSDNIIACGNDSQIVQLWNINTGECLKTLQGHGSRVYSVAYSRKSNIFASGSEDRVVRIWDASTGKCLRELFDHTHWIWSVAFSPDGTKLASAGEDRIVYLWDVGTGKKIKTLRGHANRVFMVAFSPNGSMIASSSGDLHVKLWDVRTGECLNTLQGHSGRVYSISFSSDGKTLVSGSDDRTIKIWSVDKGECLNTIKWLSNRVRSVKYSPNNKLVAFGDDKTVKIWDVYSNMCIRAMKVHSGGIWSVDFSPDGSAIVTGGEDKTVRLWDVNSGFCRKTIQEPNGAVYSVAFGQDEDTIAGSTEKGVINVWNMRTGECLYQLKSQRPYEGMNISRATGLTALQVASLKALGAIEKE